MSLLTIHNVAPYSDEKPITLTVAKEDFGNTLAWLMRSLFVGRDNTFGRPTYRRFEDSTDSLTCNFTRSEFVEATGYWYDSCELADFLQPHIDDFDGQGPEFLGFLRTVSNEYALSTISSYKRRSRTYAYRIVAPVDLIGKIEENIPRSWLSKQESTHKGSTGWGATHDSTIMLRKSLDFSYQGEAFQSLVTLINKVAQPKTAIVYPLAFNAGYICQLDKQIMIDDFDELLNKKLLGTVNGYGAFTRAEKPISVLERDLLLNY